MKKIWLWILGLALSLLFVYFIASLLYSYDETGTKCVPATCCHAKKCTLSAKDLDCAGVVCSMGCVDGTMDCGAGRCDFVDGECEVVWNE